MRKIISFIMLCFMLSSLVAQVDVEDKTHSENEMITLSRSISFAEAMKALETFSDFYENKKIINTSSVSEPIGFPIHKIYWKDALELLIKLNNVTMEELPGSYVIKDPIIEEKIDENAITADSKLIKISGILFKADRSFTRSLGIDWSTLIGGEVNANINFTTSQNISTNMFDISANKTFSSGNTTINVQTLIKVLESKQKGSVIARPNISVLSGKKGFMQVGQNFSIKTIDEEGNTTDEFFETGIILEVQPKVIAYGDEDIIYLNVTFEKSTATPGEISTVINKSESTTELLLFDGEEAVIGGLYDTDTTIERIGIPILKDLPWWFLGLRYLFGYNSVKEQENELIVILKAEIVTPISERIKQHKKTTEKVKNQAEDFEKVKKMFEKQ
jgi:type IV pilus assembly protein PilQ